MGQEKKGRRGGSIKGRKEMESIRGHKGWKFQVDVSTNFAALCVYPNQ